MAVHPSILAWEIPWIYEFWCAVVRGVAKSQTQLSDSPPIVPSLKCVTYACLEYTYKI